MEARSILAAVKVFDPEDVMAFNGDLLRITVERMLEELRAHPLFDIRPGRRVMLKLSYWEEIIPEEEPAP